MKYFLIAGEASGDMHAANLIKEIKEIDKEARIKFWGGNEMQKSSGEIALKHIDEIAIMGFFEVLKNIITIKKNFTACKKHISDFMPDAVIFVDYPGFNLRIAPFVKSLGIKTFYYISPKVWAWKENRVLKIKEYIDKLYSILPFEEKFYNNYNYKIKYIGNPLMDAIKNHQRKDTFRNSMPYIALLPGSRKQEIERMLPIMIKAIEKFNGFKFVLAASDSFNKNYYYNFIHDKDIFLHYGSTYDVLENAEAALVTSGTATLETALFNVPQIVCYKANNISYFIARLLVKIKYISLVNLILDKNAVVELIQHKLTPYNIELELKEIIKNGNKRNQILENYNKLSKIVGSAGASKRAAKDIFSTLKKK